MDLQGVLLGGSEGRQRVRQPRTDPVTRCGYHGQQPSLLVCVKVVFARFLVVLVESYNKNFPLNIIVWPQFLLVASAAEFTQQTQPRLYPTYVNTHRLTS
jgi:hypothetical protein